MKNFFLVDDNFVNTRLDKWIKRNVHQFPQSFIEKNLRQGKIKLNNKKIKSSYKLKKNDQITLHNFNFTTNINKKYKNSYIPTKRELSFSSKIFIENNENFVVINKPPDIAVQSGTKSKKNILDILKKTKEFSGYYPYSVHRIDKETTGILIVAKNRKYAQIFTTLFRMRKIHKTYLGVVLGSFQEIKGTYTDILTHDERGKKVHTKAITHYNVIDSNKNYSLLKLNPETGRKHQIRKQLLIHGHPIIGDSKYKFVEKKLSKNNKLMLHALKINFSISNRKYIFYAEPPLDFKDFLKKKYLRIY